MSYDDSREIIFCNDLWYSKIFHYNNSFLHEFIHKNFQL